MMSPWFASGTVTTSSLTGSSRIGLAFASASASPIDGRGLERHLGAVDGVVLAVEARDLHVDDREAERAAVLLGLGDALLDRGEEVPRDHAADDRVDELVAGAALAAARPRSHATANWPWPPRLLLELAFGLGLAVDRLAVRDAHVFGVDLDAELARELLERDRQVRLAHAAQHGLVRLGVAVDAQDRGLLPGAGAARSRACPRRPSTRALIATASTGSGGGDRFDLEASVPFAVSTSPVPVSASLATAAMSPAATSVTVSCSLPRIVNSWCMRSSPLVAAVREHVVVLDGALQHLEEVHVADVGVDDRLEHDRGGGPVARPSARAPPRRGTWRAGRCR